LELGAWVVTAPEEAAAEIEKLRAHVARLGAELASAEAVASHAAVGWPSPSHARLHVLARSRRRSTAAADDAERRVTAAPRGRWGATLPPIVGAGAGGKSASLRDGMSSSLSPPVLDSFFVTDPSSTL
jgi:hypothetical protein